MKTCGWENKRIGEFANTMSGGTPSTNINSYWENGTIPWINSGELSQCDFIRKPSKLITEKAVKLSAAKIVPKGSVGIALTGATTGKVGYFEIDTTTNQSITSILPNDTVDTLFLFYVLKNSREKILRFNIGSAQPHINKQIVDELYVEFPSSINEQKKIAEILFKLDIAIEHIEAIITKQEKIKTGVMQDLLTKGIDENGNIRSEKTHPFKNSLLGRIPEDWDVSTIGECCDIFNNLRKPISSLVRETMKGDYAYYGPTGILDYINEYRVDGKYVLIGEDGDHFLKFKTQEITILIEGKCNVNNHAHIVAGKERVLTEWIHLFFMHRDITFYLTRQGAGRFKLNKAALLNLPLLVPRDKDEQGEILKIINSVRTDYQNSQDTLSKLKSIKTALMQDLLTGKKSVSHLLDDWGNCYES